jgi:hypothetical protein
MSSNLTHKAMMNPKVGDRFEEFYTHWVYVIKVTRLFVWTMSASVPCTFPQDGKLEKRTKTDFRKYYSYHNSLENKYWVSLCDRGNNTDGWMDDH